MLMCDGYATTEKKDSEIEMMVAGANVNLSQLVNLMRDYNKTHKKDVNIVDFYIDHKTIFGRNQELPSNPVGIYFFGEVKKGSIVFTFGKNNKTLDYLKGFVKTRDTIEYLE